MSFFGHLRSSQAQAAPVKKPECVVHPLNAPRTVPDGGYPKDFSLYQYAGAMIETIGFRSDADGIVLRRPTLVANMSHEYDLNGMKIREDMTVSIKDLMTFRDAQTKQVGHPNAKAISAALTTYYENKIAPEHQEAAIKQRASESRPQTELIKSVDPDVVKHTTEATTPA